jgi:hypothetical protein
MIPIEYQLTFEEYVEAARLQVRVRMWVVVIVGTALSTIMLLPPPTASAAFGLGGLEPILVWLVLLAFIGGSLFFSLRTASWRPWRRKSRRIKAIMPAWFRRFVIPAISILITGWVITIRWRYEFEAARADAARTGVSFSELETTIGTLMLVIMFALYSIPQSVTAMFTRIGGIFGWPYAQGWKNQSNLRRPMTAEFSESGCVISEPLSRHEYHWDYFPGWTETPNLFIFYISNRLLVIFPKRAFTSDAQRNEFVQLVDRHISEALPAFPVQPVGTNAAERPVPAPSPGRV